MKLVVDLLLLVLLLSAIVVHRAAQFMPAKELKRRARLGRDPKAARIFRMAAYGPSFYILMWVIGSLSAAVLLVMAARTSGPLTLVFIVVLAWLLFGWRPAPSTMGWEWSVAAGAATVYATLLSWLQPLLGRLEKWHPSARPIPVRTGIYEKEDLLELINHQNNQSDNRIPESDLKMTFSVLTFGDRPVEEIMTPLRQIHMVNQDEGIGPILMDELHATGFSRFPVTKEKSGPPEIVGTLYLRDLVGHTGKGKVRDLMDKKVFYINDTQELRQALAAFLQTQHHLFMVVNNFEELVGVLSIEDVIEQALGEKIVDEFDKHDDLRAVAARQAAKDQKQHTSV